MIRNTQELDEIRGFCRSRLSALISEGLDPLPSCLFDLEALLNADVVNLEKINQILSANVRFSRRILRLANEMLAGSSEPVRNLSDAVVMLGPSMFHSVTLLCAVTQIGDYDARHENARSIWSHSLKIALVSEGIARQAHYPACGVAFTAGLVHDIGYVPMLLVAREQQRVFEMPSAMRWRDHIDLERELFGLDHCQVGRWMAKSWNFSDSIVDAVVHHHDPRVAVVDRRLAEIVSTAETSCELSQHLGFHRNSNIPPRLAGSVVH